VLVIMRALRMLRLRLRSLLRVDRVEQDLHDELRDHLEREIERHRAAGLSPAAARAAAIREFGNIALIQEHVRDTRGIGGIEHTLRDVRYALRSMRRAPVFTLVAVVSLALGIGANAAVFSLIDHVILKTLPVSDPQRLFFVDNSGGKSGGTSGPPYPCYEILRDNNRFLSSIAAFDENRFKVTIDGVPEQVRGQYASGSYFELLGIDAVHGRVLTQRDDSSVGQGGPQGAVAVISHGFWQRRFGGAPSVLGRRIMVGTSEVTIVGVTPPAFTGLRVGGPIDLTVPMMLAGRNLGSRSLWWFSVIGRLKPDASVEQARADLQTLWARYMDDVGQPRGPDSYFNGIAMVPAARGLHALRRDFSRPLTILMAIVAVVLLIGCANVANLLVARAGARRHEMAVRLAVGASRGRLVRQLFTEGAVLAAISAACGLVFARWGVSFLTGFFANRGDGILLDPAFDLRLVSFTAAVASLAAIAFSLAPALHATGHDAAQPGRGGVAAAGSRSRLGQALIVAQVTLSVALLCAAALFVQTLRNLHALDSGFDREGILTMQVDAVMPRVTAEPRTPERRAAHARAGAVWEDLAARVREIPGVRWASVATMSPLTGRDRGVLVEALGADIAGRDREIHINQVTSGYFGAMGIDVVAGRPLTPSDRGSSARAAVLNDSAARLYFGAAGAAIGRLIRFPGQTIGDFYEVVGVVRDTRYENLRTPDERMAYLPIEQSLDPVTDAMVVVRGAGNVTRFLPPIREAVGAAVPEGFVTRVGTMEDRQRASLLRERLLSTLAAFCGVLALALASIGLYGVMAYGVVRRTRELATHIAIGAPRASVVWMVVRNTFTLVLIGAVGGVAVAVALSRWIREQLFGVKPGDPAAIAAAILLLLAVSLAAGYLPARRAVRIDPVRALRIE
jgi:predicted permease